MNVLDPFKSNEERFFWSMVQTLPQIVPALDGYSLISSCYEPFSLNLGSGVYTPDFLLYLSTGVGNLVVLFEVKGSKKQRGYRETRAKLKEATALYPMFIFYEVMVVKNSFSSFELISAPPFPYLWAGT